MTYTVRFRSEKIGPASVEEIEHRLGGRKLTGLEPVTYHSRMGDCFGKASSFPEFKALIGPSGAGVPEAEFTGPHQYVPNHIPLGKRLFAIGAICVSAFILYEYVTTGQTTVSVGKRGPSLTVSGLWGLPAVAMFGGALSAGLAIMVDHYDRRPNEKIYSVWLTVSATAMIIGKLSALIVIHHMRAQNP